MLDYYNPFSINTSTPQYTSGYYSSSPAQPGIYGPNQYGIGYGSNYNPPTVNNNGASYSNPQSQPATDGIASAIGRGVSAGIGMIPDNTDDFSIDPFAGYKGSAAGGGMGAAGAIGAIIGGVGAQVGTFSKVNRNLKGLNTNVSGYQIGPDGRPVYDNAGIQTAMQNQASVQKGLDSIGGVKSLYDPATFVFSKLFGTKKRLNRAKRKLGEGIQSAQAGYNRAAESYSSQQQAENAWRNSQFEMFNNSLSLPQPYSSYF